MIRASDLLIGNQILTAQSQQIKPLHDAATMVLPVVPESEVS